MHLPPRERVSDAPGPEIEAELEGLRIAILKHSVKFGESFNKNGNLLAWSFDLRELLYRPEHLKAIAELLWMRVRGLRPDYVGGMTLSAEQLVAGVARAALEDGVVLGGFSIRQTAKTYGLRRRLEGVRPHRGARVLIVDDLLGMGNTAREVLSVVSQTGANIVGFAFVLDFGYEEPRRRLGATPFFSLFGLDALQISAPGPTPERRPAWRRGPLNASDYTAPQSSPLIDAQGIVAAGDRGSVVGFDHGGQAMWRFDIKPSEHGIRTALIAVEQSVIFGGYDGMIYRVDRATGRCIWAVAAGAKAAASPAIDAGAEVGYFAVNHAAPGCDFLAVRLTDGSVIWRRKGAEYSFARPAFAGAESVIFADNNGLVQCVSRLRGEVLWETRLPAQIKGWISVQGSRCFMGCFDGRVYALDVSNGRMLWARKLAAWLLIHPITTGDKLLVSAASHLCCLSQADGTLCWTASMGGRAVGAGVDAARGIAVLGTDNGLFLCLDPATGKRLWQYQAAGAFRCSPALGNGFCAAPNYDGNLYVFDLDREGKLRR